MNSGLSNGPASTPVSGLDWRLAAGELHVRQVPLAGEGAELDSAYGLLSADERGRAQRLLSPEVARRFILARAGLRRILAGYLDADPVGIAFTYGPQGRPELAEACNPAHLRFSLSHSGALALVAMTMRSAVGLDLEECRELSDLDGIARTALAPEECACFSATPRDDRLRVFYALWTAREAFSKAIGTGLSMPRDSVQVRLEGGIPRLETDGSPAWLLYPLELPSGYCGAVVVQTSAPLQFRQGLVEIQDRIVSPLDNDGGLS